MNFFKKKNSQTNSKLTKPDIEKLLQEAYQANPKCYEKEDGTLLIGLAQPLDWCETDIMRAENVKEVYKKVCNGLDELLKKHGYEREGMHYRAIKPNNDTIVLFCHFGVECVMLSHLLQISPMILWHNFCALPTSITSIYTEERRKELQVFE